MPGNVQWADTLPKLVQSRIMQALENAASAKTIVRTADNLTAERQLLLEIRSFDLVTGEKTEAMVQIAARIVAEGNQVIDAQVFAATALAQSADGAIAAAAFNKAFGSVAVDLVVWVNEVNQ